MTKATERKPKEYLKKFIRDPRSIKPGTAMPKLGLSEQEADDLIAFLDWTSKVDTNGWPPKPILAVATAGKTTNIGEFLFRKNDCSACHQIQGIGGTAGPDLTHVGTRRPDADWHIRHLKDPSSVVKDSAMPAFSGLTDEESKALSEYLTTLK
jgi:nitric oxide reductase subunit C